LHLLKYSMKPLRYSEIVCQVNTLNLIKLEVTLPYKLYNLAIGEFLNDLRHGKGVHINADGVRFKGTWQNGKSNIDLIEAKITPELVDRAYRSIQSMTEKDRVEYGRKFVQSVADQLGTDTHTVMMLFSPLFDK